MEKAKKARERDCYIKPIKAWKLMKAADEENMTTYIYGVTGSGKTSLVKHYMIRQKET
jgi:LuxR family maltose regulon positive regulatory protein